MVKLTSCLSEWVSQRGQEGDLSDWECGKHSCWCQTGCRCFTHCCRSPGSFTALNCSWGSHGVFPKMRKWTERQSVTDINYQKHVLQHAIRGRAKSASRAFFTEGHIGDMVSLKGPLVVNNNWLKWANRLIYCPFNVNYSGWGNHIGPSMKKQLFLFHKYNKNRLYGPVISIICHKPNTRMISILIYFVKLGLKQWNMLQNKCSR